MAGSFGFESDKYDVSLAIAEHGLLPRIREAADSTAIVADGFSCREQVAQLTDRHALHTAELVNMAMQRSMPHSGNPEEPVVRKRNDELRKSRHRAAAVLGIAAAVAFTLPFLWRRIRS